MGADIHTHLQYRKKGETEWRDSYTQIRLGRDYYAFALLAGVRGWADPVFDPRGFPTDSDIPRDFTLYVREQEDEEYTEGWCSRAEAKRWGSEIRKTSWGTEFVIDPDLHTPSYLSTKEYKKVLKTYKNESNNNPDQLEPGIDYQILLSVMKTYEKQGFEARLVFCFDN